MDHKEIITDIKNVSEKILNLLKQENEFLNKMDIDKISDLTQEKTDLVVELEAQKVLLKQYPEIVTSMNEEERKDLTLLSLELEKTMKENIDKLIIANEFNALILQAIEDAVISSKNRIYGEDGKVKKQKKAPAISVKSSV